MQAAPADIQFAFSEFAAMGTCRLQATYAELRMPNTELLLPACSDGQWCVAGFAVSSLGVEPSSKFTGCRRFVNHVAKRSCDGEWPHGLQATLQVKSRGRGCNCCLPRQPLEALALASKL